MNTPNSNPRPDRLQLVSTEEVNLMQIREEIIRLRTVIHELSEMMAQHMKQNMDTVHMIDAYIHDQIAYRLYRQNLDESSITLELARKNLELEFLDKKYKELESVKKEEGAEAEALKFEYQRQKLEIEDLENRLHLLQEVRSSTKDRMPSMTAPSSMKHTEVRDLILKTVVGTVTALCVTGTAAFVIWLIRFYILNTQP